MIALNAGKRSSLNEHAPMPVSLLLDIPREIIPLVSARLPGPDLLSLARASKQIPLENKQELLKAWATRELQEIGTLSDEQRWVRFLDLSRNCMKLIDNGTWRDFLATIETRCAGEGVLLGLANFSPKTDEASHRTIEATYAEVMQPGTASSDRFLALCETAASAPWAGRAVASVIVGYWEQLILPREVKSHFRSAVDQELVEGRLMRHVPFISRFVQMPLASQIDVIVSLRRLPKAYGPLRSTFTGLFASVAGKWLEDIAQPAGQFAAGGPLSSARPSLLLFLNMFHESDGRIDHSAFSLDPVADFVAGQFTVLAGTGAWREQEPELALCLLLTLKEKLKQPGATLGFAQRLIGAGFLSSRELAQFRACVADRKNASASIVRNWIGSKRVEKPVSECTIS